MKVTTEKIDNHKVVLEITVPQEEVKKGLDLAFAKLSKKINIPGFRKGKVPRNVLISKIGKQALLEEAFDIVAPNALNKALVEQNLDPVVRPEVDIITLEEEKELVFKATIVPKPEIELGEYKNLKVENWKLFIFSYCNITILILKTKYLFLNLNFNLIYEHF